jgi:hypothetical protein
MDQASTEVATVSATLEKIIAEVSKAANMEGIGPDTKIGEINLDSLKFVELLLEFTALFPGEIELDRLNVDAQTTLRQLDSQLSGELADTVAEA